MGTQGREEDGWGDGAGQCGTPGKPGTASPGQPWTDGELWSQKDGSGAWAPFLSRPHGLAGGGRRTRTQGQARGREVKAAQARSSPGPLLSGVDNPWSNRPLLVGREPSNPTRPPGPARLPVWAICFSAQRRRGPPPGWGAELWVPRPSLVQCRGQLWAWELGSVHGDDRPQAAGCPAAPAWLSAKALVAGGFAEKPPGEGRWAS